MILMSSKGRPFSPCTRVRSMSFTTLCPFSTFPKMVCFPSSHGVGTVVMKNCELFVHRPAFAIASRNGLSNVTPRTISSSKGRFHMLSPP